MTIPVLTVDGPSGAGKGTVGLRLARKLGWHFLDSGALYRVLGWAALAHGVPLDDEAALAELAEKLDIRFEAEDDLVSVVIDGRPVGDALRTEAVADAASQVAAVPAVRAALLQKQRDFRRKPGLVADGRDMGTTVFADAGTKIFLTASAEERARRRHKQLKLKGFDVNLARLVEEIEQRDARDANRPTSPLRPAEDAIVIDTSEMSIDDVVDRILALVAKTGQ